MKRLIPLILLIFVFLLLLAPATTRARAFVSMQTSMFFVYLPLIMKGDPVSGSGAGAGPWNLVWSDEFNGVSIDKTNWTYDIGTGVNGWGNLELEYYTNLSQNSWVQNGMLTIQALQQNYQGMNYTSARMLTNGLRQFQYGLVEARMKLPEGQGIWPTFWMVGGPESNWPNDGEIDIMEYIGRTPDTLYTTLHGPGYSGANGIGSHFNVAAGTLQSNWHVYAIDWEPNSVTWLFDGAQVFQVTPAQIPVGTTWVFNHPFYIILNVAVGGRFPGNPDATSVFPQQLLVDWVRVYQHP